MSRAMKFRALSLVLALVLSSAGSLIVGSTRGTATQSSDDVTTFDPARFAFAVEPVVGGFDQPLYVTDPGDGSGRLFVVEQGGLVRIVQDGEVLPEPFLDLTGVVDTSGSERGLLSIAFHPQFEENGFFYAGYTEPAANVVTRFAVSREDPDRADPDSGSTVLRVDDPYSNHNGGLVLFGPDGYLYTTFGDGGAGGDPQGNGQNMDSLLGKILRLDVDTGEDVDDPAYAIPADNPFADGSGGRPEIWASGVRNPWRFSFDRATGDFYMADVGQNRYEEVNFQPADSTGGENYGWALTEGGHCFPEDEACDTEELVLPVAEYDHDLGISVTGGYVYRGEAIPSLQGVYLYADFGSGLVWGLGRDASGAWMTSDPVESGLNPSSFGEDATGELYVTSFDGTLYRVVDPAA